MTDSHAPLRLRHSATSPYVRKVMVVAHETGLADRIEVVPTDVWSDDTDIGEDSPLGKVPALRLGDGRVLVESACISDFLDHLHAGPRLFPQDLEPRLIATRWMALGDGLTNALVTQIIERRFRATDDRQAWWIDRQARAVKGTLDLLEHEAGALTDAPLSIGHIAIGAALGYMDFRFSDDFWRENRPALAAWFDTFTQRPSMRATEPPKG